MSKKHLTIAIEAFMQGNIDKAIAFTKRCIELKSQAIVNEDHEKSMSEEELKHYIKDLHSKAKDEHKEAFAKHLDAEECNDEAFGAAAKKYGKDKVKADHLIHKLEKLVGSKIDPKEYKTDKEEGESDTEAEKESKMKKDQVKESVLNEISAKTLSSYIKKSATDIAKKTTDTDEDKDGKKFMHVIKRHGGIQKASSKLLKKAEGK